MNTNDLQTACMPQLDNIVERLCHPSSLNEVWHNPAEGAAMPSIDELREILDRLCAAIFPGYFGQARVRRESMRCHLAANLNSIYHKLSEQILRGFCFVCEKHTLSCAARESASKNAAMAFMDMLPEIRRLLAGDAKAAYEGDPAATSPGETIFCYPSMRAMLHHRIAHALHKLSVPVIPRIISEIAHAHTGIDIHPGATIGEDFFIDHGTGVVIGETCILGRSCRLYQGVTLGAHFFAKNPDGSLIKGIARHPILEDSVTVYSGATILGRITIGRGAVIGGNVWVTSDVAPGAKISQENPQG
ncbi:serine O-acetyltransferase EpsC [Candidatus Desulfovibrio trichonymphae]|uniref:Serine O-acetyltransferase n=1 Tax=Candidatus Desulfovibrio trichonymphae TaxID=1725232 RepID=A0A1J1DPH9_9BACT|nr:serine O-acetyltransferase EpsC [Candidatus Desulfovibrio trichonymphae]BAV91751.1 serine O-acetyltransferase [Candidatus Desulfovibrio trichonymphae]